MCVCVRERTISHSVYIKIQGVVSVYACDITAPTNGTYYIDEISWEISLLVPLINTKCIEITQFFFFVPLRSLFFSVMLGST